MEMDKGASLYTEDYGCKTGFGALVFTTDISLDF